MGKEEMDIIDMLLDEDNDESITLFDETGEPFSFEQVAVIPKDDILYAILKPLQHVDGLSDEDMLIFKIFETDDGEADMEMVTDDAEAEAVFEELNSLMEEAETE